MKILHILKKAPDASTGKIIEIQATGNQSVIIELHKGAVSYDKLIEEVFNSGKVFCW